MQADWEPEDLIDAWTLVKDGWKLIANNSGTTRLGFADYSWTGRTIKYHRAQIRSEYGTRGPTEADEERWAQWLAEGNMPGRNEPGTAGQRPAQPLPE